MEARCEDFDRSKVATLANGGWADSYKNAVPTLIKNLKAPVKGIVGPWAHKYPHFASPEPRIGFLQEATRWWDYWLKGLDTGVLKDPRYAVYLMNGVRPKTKYDKRDGRWIDGTALDQKAKKQLWYLGSNQNLEIISKSHQTINVLISSPQDCGMASGEFCAIWLGADMPGDQRSDDAKSASVPYTNQSVYPSTAVSIVILFTFACLISFEFNSNDVSSLKIFFKEILSIFFFGDQLVPFKLSSIIF